MGAYQVWDRACPRRSWAVTGVAHCVPSQRGVSLGLVPAWQDGWSPAAGAAVVLAVYCGLLLWVLCSVCGKDSVGWERWSTCWQKFPPDLTQHRNNLIRDDPWRWVLSAWAQPSSGRKPLATVSQCIPPPSPWWSVFFGAPECHRSAHCADCWPSLPFSWRISGTSDPAIITLLLSFLPLFYRFHHNRVGKSCRFASRSLVNAFLAKTFSFHLYFCRLPYRKIPATRQAFRWFSLNFSFSRTTDRND